jgi:hypothetical protein
VLEHLRFAMSKPAPINHVVMMYLAKGVLRSSDVAQLELLIQHWFRCKNGVFILGQNEEKTSILFAVDKSDVPLIHPGFVIVR